MISSTGRWAAFSEPISRLCLKRRIEGGARVTLVTLVPGWTASELPSFDVVELRCGLQSCQALRPRAAVRNAARPSPTGRRGGAACAGTDAGAASGTSLGTAADLVTPAHLGSCGRSAFPPGQDGIKTGE